MDAKDFGNIIALARRAPLANMDEAEAAAKLLQKFARFAKAHIDSQAGKEPEPNENQ